MTVNTLSAAQAPAQPSAPAAADPKLANAAREFEAMMLQELLKPLSFGSSPDQGDAEVTGAADTVRGFGTEAIAKAVASQGGFGIARQIIRQVSAEREAQQENPVGTKV